MRTILRSLFIGCALSSVALAQRPTSRDAILVSPAWLASHLKDPNLVLLHVGDRAEYDAGHIPGARYVPLDSISTSGAAGNGLTLEMPAAERLRAGLAGLGVSDDSRIVVYYGKDRVASTTRVVFTLDYAGLGDRTSLLDGGMPAWTRAGNAVTAEPTAARAGQLAALKIKPIVVDADYVRAHLGKPGVSVVDARLTNFYDGTQTGGNRDTPHKTGHVAGAKSIPFADLADAQFAWKAADQLTAMFAKAGVAPGDTVIGYCHIGAQATAMLFAARSLGYPVLLYDGSFEDWSKRDLPVEKKP